MLLSRDFDIIYMVFCVPIAQLDRASDYGSEGWGFKSSWARHFLREIKARVILLLFSFLYLHKSCVIIIVLRGEMMRIALIAHDKKKKDIIEFALKYHDFLKQHTLYATGTTGRMIEEQTGLNIHRFKSGPLGGDQEIGAKVAKEEIDMVIFFRDPLTAQPHEPDISALLRLCDVYEIPLATNKNTAALLIIGSCK